MGVKMKMNTLLSPGIISVHFYSFVAEKYNRELTDMFMHLLYMFTTILIIKVLYNII